MTDKRPESDKIKDSLEPSPNDAQNTKRSQKNSYDQYLSAMRRVQRQSMTAQEMQSPRQRRRKTELAKVESRGIEGNMADTGQARRISTIASMIPDEIIYKYSDYSIRKYESALMFIDVSGFTELCEKYRKTGRDGASRLTQVLNSYIGAMVQEILTHNGDVLNFSGDAFISMWKTTPTLTTQIAVHTAIDCGLIIQKNYGRHVTDVGVVLKVKVAISVGTASFAIIGNKNMRHYILIGEPVWDVKTAEYMTSAGDVLTTNKAWAYVNQQEYCTQPCGDGRHTKVLGVGVTWKHVEKSRHATKSSVVLKDVPSCSRPSSVAWTQPINYVKPNFESKTPEVKEYSLRPAIVSAFRNSWWPALRSFMLTPVLMAVDNDEPMDYLTEIRHVVIVFINIITRTVTDHVLIGIVDDAYKLVCSITSESGGLVNKVSMFDKDMMFLVVFGLRGLKQKDEAQKALLCASQIKDNLSDPNILSVSVGITSGTTYCGVVGHVLRREYTVIGSAVNKAARLMIAYNNKVTCDKETFISGKLGLDLFRLMEVKALKGIEKPGPIYEFNKSGWVDRPVVWRHPILGREEELIKYKSILKHAIYQHHERFTRYRDHKFGVAIVGSAMLGKGRLLEEFLTMTPNPMQLHKIILTESDKEVPFGLIHKVMSGVARSRFIKNNMKLNTSASQETVENIIRFSIGSTLMSPVQIHALNVIFDCRFPLPETFVYEGNILDDPNVRDILEIIFKGTFPSLRVVPVMYAHFMDDRSWQVLLIMLETKHIFVILTIGKKSLSGTAKSCLENHMIVKMYVSSVDRKYHAALACQFLDVQAIPADLEKVIESASNGMPGWIQNFLVSLIQRSELTVVTVPRSEAVDAGAVLPSIALLQRANNEASSAAYKVADSDTIQMAVLKDSYNFEDLKVDMTMDVIILKTYDSLNPFEKMVLKCGSVLGEVFTRRMLLHLIQSDSLRKVSEAVAKLFEIRVLECEGGDFTRDTSLVLVHPAPAAVPNQPPYCICIGARQSHDCRDLPTYAFCGYMKFRHTLFRKTTYELLTEGQKREMHSRALMYLERNTRRCSSCGTGCFSKLFGVICDDGLVEESKELKRVRQQIAALSAETRMTSETVPQDEEYASFDSPNVEQLHFTNRKSKRVRSFSSLDLENCECMPILMAVYGQVTDHVRSIGNCGKIVETYLEHADLSVMNLNLPQAFRLLCELEEFINNDVMCEKDQCKIKWMKDFRLARILTARAWCLLETGDYSEARKQLFRAMELYCDPFPTNKLAVKLHDIKCSFQQTMALYVAPELYVATETGFAGFYYEMISKTLSKLYKLFAICNENENAALTAKWQLNYALKSHKTFRLLCNAFANMIAVYRQKQKFSKCAKLENMAIDICHRKRGQLDVTDVYAVCSLYTNIFLFYVESGKKMESLEFGLSVIPMITRFSDLTVCQILVLWVLKLLLPALRLHEMVMIMREFFYMTDNYDLSSETWYYHHTIMIMLDTGYCVESYGACERFYIKRGNAIIRSKAPEAAWNFFVCMWLITIRTDSWERAILWEDKIKEIKTMRLPRPEYNFMMIVRLVEGFLILMAREIENRNFHKKNEMEKQVLVLLKEISKACRRAPYYRPRYLLYYAYYYYIKGKIPKAYRHLGKASQQAKEHDIKSIAIWIQHTQNHWDGQLSSKFVNYWTEHVEEDNLLDYRNYDPGQTQIVPFTLPVPRDVDKF